MAIAAAAVASSALLVLLLSLPLLPMSSSALCWLRTETGCALAEAAAEGREEELLQPVKGPSMRTSLLG